MNKGNEEKWWSVMKTIKYLENLDNDQELIDLFNLTCSVTLKGKKEFGLYHLNKKMLLGDLRKYMNNQSKGYEFYDWIDEIIFITKFKKMVVDKKLPFSFIEKYKERYWFKYQFLKDFKSIESGVSFSGRIKDSNIWKINNDPYKLLQSYESKIIDRVLESDNKVHYWYYRLIRDINNYFNQKNLNEWTLPNRGVVYNHQLSPRWFGKKEELIFDKKNRFVGISYTDERDEYNWYWKNRYLKEIKRFKNEFDNSWKEVCEYSLK